MSASFFWRHIGRLALAVLGLHFVLVAPTRPQEWGLDAFLVPPVEAGVVTGLLLLAPAAWQRGASALLLPLVALALALKGAELASRSALGRAFHPVYDLHLVGSGWTLLQGAVGPTKAWGLATLAIAAFILLVLASAAAVRTLARTRARRTGATFLALATLAAVVVPAPHFATAGLLARQTTDGVAGLRSLRDFTREAAVDVFRDVPDERLLAELVGRDVLFLFIESYGRSAVEHPRYAPTIRPRLAAFEEVVEAAGYEARSGWLTAPIKGGQSWLAHASVLSGLTIDSQQRYSSLISSERETLIHGFARAGWRTVAVMPAITMAWPEGAFFDYDAIYAAGDLGYAGAPFNWVTMPDQYTMAALERLELDRAPRGPVMAEVALISSHAPWTPIPPVLPWDDVGDGRVFTPHALAGDPPNVVWRDIERIRAQYLKAVDYALANLASYVEHFGRDDLVLVVVGDHQPAPLVTGEDAGYDVPMHVIAAPEVLERIEGWDWTPGLVPAAKLPAWRMDAFRDRFYAAFSASPPTPARLAGAPD